MSKDFKVLPGGLGEVRGPDNDVLMEDQRRHFRNVCGSLLQDALDEWGEVWDQFQGSLTHGAMIVPEMEKNFVPECGWPEFLERLWLLRHYIDHAKRFCEGTD